jgi:hypothetical protein
MANGKNPGQPQGQQPGQPQGQQPAAPQLAPEHQAALQAAGVDPTKFQTFDFKKIAGLIQAILGAWLSANP